MPPRPQRGRVPTDAAPLRPVDVTDADKLLIEHLTEMTSSPGWRWLVEHANAEFGSGATCTRIRAAMGENLPPEVFGMVTNAIMASRAAVDRLLAMPKERTEQIQNERRRQKALIS